MSPLSDEDVDRIARRVAWKLVVYGLLILAVLWIVQYVVFAVVALLSAGTNGNMFVVILPLATALLGVPLVLLIWIWGRSRPSR